jgi:serine protease Do
MLAWSLLAPPLALSATVTSERQQSIRAAAFEVVLKKPEHDPVRYEKPLPLELLPYIERTDAYRSIGTAFALGHNTYVTAGHVILAGINSQFGEPALRSSDGKVYAIDRILKFSAHEDFVVFSLVGDPAPPGFETSRTPKIDDAVHAVGNALGDGVVIRDGLFTSETAEEQDGRWKWIRFSAAASPGNSGGPLLDQDGKVIGVVIGKSPNENLNYALPIARVLDAPAGKALFDQRSLTSLPFMQGGKTYTMKDEFALPLGWPEFSKSFQELTARHHDAARAQFLEAHAATMFPRGLGTESLLFDTNGNLGYPWLVTQQPDDSWTASVPRYANVDLPGDGSVSVANGGEVGLLRLVRPDHATDDAFFQDSKAFMDFALRALDVRRKVGADQVKVTSLGPAISESGHVDRYGRHWQLRVWPVAYADEYVLALLLPTPDGYGGIVDRVSSSDLRDAQRQALLMTDQFELSYEGTLAQWQAFLARKALLPAALKAVLLSGAPTWTLRSPHFQIAVPPRLFAIDKDSLLMLVMGFMNSPTGVVCDIGDVWWYRDTHKEMALGLWRRPRPPESARVELRNVWSDMQQRRTPFDGEMDRVGAKTYALTTMLDVPGKTAGMIAADLLYAVTALLDRSASDQEPSYLKNLLAESTRLYEHGTGAEQSAPSNGAASGKAGDSTLSDDYFASLRQWNAEHGTSAGKDIRGRLFSDDVRDYLEILRPDGGKKPGGSKPANPAAQAGVVSQPVVAELERRSRDLSDYWEVAPSVVHNRDLWGTFLLRNHLPPDTRHNKAVLAAEEKMTTTLSQPLGPQWSKSASELAAAYVAERDSSVRILSRANSATPQVSYRRRVSACPAPATRSSGSAVAGIGEVRSSLSEYYPPTLQRQAVEGTVVLTLRIDATGCVTEAGISGSSGSEELDNAALSWVETASFLPAERDGKAVASEKPLAVNFRLRG